MIETSIEVTVVPGEAYPIIVALHTPDGKEVGRMECSVAEAKDLANKLLHQAAVLEA